MREHPTSEENYYGNANQILLDYYENRRENADDGKYYNYQIFVFLLAPIEDCQVFYELPTRERFEQIVSDLGMDS